MQNKTAPIPRRGWEASHTARGRRPLRGSASALALLSGLALALPAAAGSVTWSGGSGGDWSSDANWAGDAHAPTAADSVLIDSAGPVVSTGTSATASDLQLGISSSGTLTLQGSLTTGAATLGVNAGGSGTLTLEGGSSFTSSGTLTVGSGGTGTVSLLSGSSLSSAATVVESGSGGTSAITLDGGSWVNAGHAQIGRNTNSTGTLTITNGGVFETQGGGFYTGDGATISVSGQGSALRIGTLHAEPPADWNAGDGWFSQGGGTTTISGGATLAADASYIDSTTGLATITVTGSGTRWENGLSLYIGGNGNGSPGRGLAIVSGGASVTSNTSALGVDSGSEGTLILSGAGTTYSVLARDPYRGNLRVGFSGTGTLVVREGALLSTDNFIEIATYGGSSGTLAIGALQGEAAAAPGFVQAAGHIRFGEGDGQIVLNHTGTDYTLAGNITGAGRLLVLSGTTRLSGTNTYSGGTTISGGTLVGSVASLGSGAIVNNGALVFEQADTATYAQAITGSGSLTKTGAGTLILTGASTYTGGTTISAGTLQIGDGGTSGSLVGTIVNNSALVFNRSDSYTFPGTITGSGTVRFTGGGTVLFESADAYTGAVTVSDTSFMLSSGSSSASSYTIGSGGTLSGSGTIGGLVVENGGLAAPGYSPGTLNVSGHVTFNAGSTYQVEVLTDGTHDQILASGTATLLGGTVAVVAESGYAIPYASYVILRADGGVSGTFGTVTSNLAFLTPLLSYDATSVSLVLARNDVSFTSLARTANQRATATAVQALGLGNTVHDRVLAQTTSGAATSFDALSGEIHASLPGLFSRQSRFLRDAVGARLRQGGTPGEGDDNGGGDAGPATRHSRLGGLTAWGQGFGNWSRAGSDGNAAALSATLGGMVLGLDAPLGAHWRAGLVTGGSRTSFRAGARGASGDSDNLDLGLYLGGQYGALGLLAGGAYTWHDIGTKRRIAFPGYASTARADYDAGTAQLFGEVHYRLPLGGLQVQPFAGLAHVRVDGGAFGERDSTAALRGSAGTVETTYTTLGLRAEGGVTLGGLALRPQASLGWQHAFGDTAGSAALAFQGGGPEFRVGGLPLARDSAILGAGLSHSLSPQLSLSISYQGQFGGEVRSNGVKGNLTYSF